MTLPSFSFPRLFSAAGLVLGTALTGQTTAHAAPITVPNFSFESPTLPDNGSSTAVPNWALSGTAAVGNPGSSEFAGAIGQGTPNGADGVQIAVVDYNSSLRSAASLTTVQSNTNYSLTFALGVNNYAPTGDMRVGFLLNDAFVTGRDITFNASTYAPAGTFKDYTFSFDSTAADAGKTLKIYFGHPTGGDYYGVDNVRLNAVSTTTTPEPSTYALMALGVGTLGLMTWKRKRGETPESSDFAGAAI